jgi:outer membrane protein W
MRIMRPALSGLLALALSPAIAADAQVKLEGSALMGATWMMSEPPARFAIESGSGGDVIVGDGELDDEGITFGASVGVRFGGRYGIEGLFTWVPTQLRAPQGLEAEGGKLEGNAYSYGVTLIYHFEESGVFKPFFGVGAGAQTTRFGPAGFRSQTEPMVNFLAGGQVELMRGLALRLDARNCISAWESRIAGTDNAVRTDAIFSAGLSFSRPIEN